MSVDADKTWLPSCYQEIDVQLCDKSLSVNVEIPLWLHEHERREGKRPTVLFRQVREYPDGVVLGNPYPRSVMFAALDVSENTWLREMSQRLKSAPRALKRGSGDWQSLTGLDSLPILQHRPRDAGRYITAGITVTKSPENGHVNLGVYRIQFVAPRRARIFFDPRTDAHANWQQSLAGGSPLPIAVFLSAHPVYMLVAASRLAPTGNDYDIAAQLLQHEVELAGDPPVPLDAHYVLRGHVTAQLETEGPFGEFKGYYVPARESPVFEIDEVLRSRRPVYPAIVSGAESGLTLMALQNEYLLYSYLTTEGFPIKRVRYPLEGLGEFVTLIESERPSLDLVRAAMDFDIRTKVVFCGPSLAAPWAAVANYGFEVHQEPYIRKGKTEGQRLGFILNQPPCGDPVEY
jgi:4-hydroxy-3-polyprenylbenzoate decarboxylase